MSSRRLGARRQRVHRERRATGGRLSEIFGPATVRADKRFLALGLRRAASAEWQTATPAVRTALQRYADGVNAALTSMGRWGRPPEFQLLRLAPEPWTPVDSLAVARLLAWRLAENRRGELVRGLLGRAIGASAANTLMGPLPPGAPTIIQGTGRVEPPTTQSPDEMPAGPVARLESPPMPPGLEWLDVTARAGGSNSWVIAGSRTATGRPLLANDPHLNVEMPSIWYEAHLIAADVDVAGVTLPGTPFVIIGHNKRIAWGLTNTGADVVDFYVEDVDMSKRQYLYRGAWQPLTVKQVHDRRARRASRTLRGLLDDPWATRCHGDRVGGPAGFRECVRSSEPEAAGPAMGSGAAG